MICLLCTIQLTILSKGSGKILVSASSQKHRTSSYQSGLTPVTSELSFSYSKVVILLTEHHLLRECHQNNLAIAPATIALFCIIGFERVAIFSDRENELVLLLPAFDGNVIISAKFGVNFGYIMIMALAT